MLSFRDASLTSLEDLEVIALKVLKAGTWAMMKIYFAFGYCLMVFVYGTVVDLMRSILDSRKGDYYPVFPRFDLHVSIEGRQEFSRSNTGRGPSASVSCPPRGASSVGLAWISEYHIGNNFLDLIIVISDLGESDTCHDPRTRQIC